MRPHIFVVCVLLGSLVTTINGQNLNRRAIQAHIDSYVTADTTEERRKEIVEELRSVPQSVLTSRIGPVLRDDAKRALGLELALALDVPGLYATVRQHRDGPDQHAIFRYGLALEERNAASDAIEQWTSLDVSEEAFSVVDGLLREFPIPFSLIEQVKRWAESASEDPKLQAAERMLQFQMGISNPLEEIIADWRTLAQEYQLASRLFRVRGTALRLNPRDASGTLVKVGHNLRLTGETRGLWEVKDEWIKDDRIIITLYVLPERDSDIELSIRSRAGGWSMQLRDDKWVTEASDEMFTTPAQRGQWTEIVFEFGPSQTQGDVKARVVEMKVNGRSHIDLCRLPDEVIGLSVRTTKGRAVVAALAWE